MSSAQTSQAAQGAQGASDAGGQAAIKTMTMQHSAFRQDMTSRLAEKNSLLKQYEAENRDLRAQAQQAQQAQSGQSGGGRELALQQQLQQMRRENSELQQRLRLPGGGGPSGGSASSKDLEELHTLRSKCGNLTKERRAVQTIMEQKIRTLVEAISKAASASPQQPGGGGANPLLAREITALRRLVDASIAALRNSASSNG
jgi:hypothetical protein